MNAILNDPRVRVTLNGAVITEFLYASEKEGKVVVPPNYPAFWLPGMPVPQEEVRYGIVRITEEVSQTAGGVRPSEGS